MFCKNEMCIDLIKRAARLMKKVAAVAIGSRTASFGNVARYRDRAPSNLLYQTESFVFGKSFRNCVYLHCERDGSLPRHIGSVATVGHREGVFVRAEPIPIHPQGRGGRFARVSQAGCLTSPTAPP